MSERMTLVNRRDRAEFELDGRVDGMHRFDNDADDLPSFGPAEAEPWVDYVFSDLTSGPGEDDVEIHSQETRMSNGTSWLTPDEAISIRRNRFDLKLKAQVDAGEHQIICVPSDGSQPTFHYSVGATPNYLVIGLSPEVGHYVLNHAVANSWALGEQHADALGGDYLCRVVEADPRVGEVATNAVRHQPDVPVLHIEHEQPGKRVFPDHPDYDHTVTQKLEQIL